MGLKLSHGDFEIACSAFNRFRKGVLTSIGGSYGPHEDKTLNDDYWYWGKGTGFNSETHKGLREFFSHSDCEGIIEPDMCKVVADELEAILLHIKRYDEENKSTGHIKGYGGYLALTKNFIEACRLAHKQGVPLEFK